MKDIVILYHAECPDGFGGAWAAHKKFGNLADYIAVEHNELVPEGLTEKEIYLIDFSYPEEITQELISKNRRVTAIDHHISAERAVKMTQDYSYSIDHSGSVLAWMYFHSNKTVPKILQYIEDRDIWKFKLEGTDPICTFIDSFDFSFGQWDQLALDIEDDSKRADSLFQGSIMFKHEQKLTQMVIEDGAKEVYFEGHKVYAVNAPYFFASHIGNILCTRKPPFSIIWRENSQKVHVSLRSDGTVDVSQIAEKFGGGGQKAAAGFDLPSIGSFPWKEIK